jgi:site-specific recombinase XerD
VLSNAGQIVLNVLLPGHTFATRLYHKTGDLHLVQRALGHRQIMTTEVDARASDGSLRRAVGLI